MKLVTILFVLTFSSFLRAEVSPAHVASMLQQMVRENVISAEEAEKARIRMLAMNKEQWKAINDQAQKVAVARGPASLQPSENKIEEVHNIDLDGAQFKQIQDDIKKIVPEYQNQ